MFLHVIVHFAALGFNVYSCIMMWGDFAQTQVQVGVTVATAKFENTSAAPLSSLLFQAAVPKYITMALEPATGTSLPPNKTGAVTQVLRLTNSMHGTKPLMIKMKLMYEKDDGTRVEELESIKFGQ